MWGFLSSPFSSWFWLLPPLLSCLHLFHLSSFLICSLFYAMCWNNKVEDLMLQKSRWAVQNAKIRITQETLRICINKLLTAPTDKSERPATPNMDLVRALQSQDKLWADFEEFPPLKPAVNNIWFSLSICIMITFFSCMYIIWEDRGVPSDLQSNIFLSKESRHWVLADSFMEQFLFKQCMFVPILPQPHITQPHLGCALNIAAWEWVVKPLFSS